MAVPVRPASSRALTQPSPASVQVASLVEAEGAACIGSVVRLSAAELDLLDRHEGIPQGSDPFSAAPPNRYRRQLVRAALGDGSAPVCGSNQPPASPPRWGWRPGLACGRRCRSRVRACCFGQGRSRRSRTSATSTRGRPTPPTPTCARATATSRRSGRSFFFRTADEPPRACSASHACGWWSAQRLDVEGALVVYDEAGTERGRWTPPLSPVALPPGTPLTR